MSARDCHEKHVLFGKLLVDYPFNIGGTSFIATRRFITKLACSNFALVVVLLAIVWPGCPQRGRGVFDAGTGTYELHEAPRKAPRFGSICLEVNQSINKVRDVHQGTGSTIRVPHISQSVCSLWAVLQSIR